MSKIIIHNNSKESDCMAVKMVECVISSGFVSGERQYCWHSHFGDSGVSVIAMPTRGETHTFKVIDEVME